jgi:hypothetical protein
MVCLKARSKGGERLFNGISHLRLLDFAELADLVADIIESIGYDSGTIRSGQKVNGRYYCQDKGSDDNGIFDSRCSFSAEKQMQYLVPCCLIGIHRGVLFKMYCSWALVLETGDNFWNDMW